MMQPYPAYKRLYDMHETLRERGEAELAYLSGQYLADLLVWYHLAWTGESVRRDNEVVVKLMTQGRGFQLCGPDAIVQCYRGIDTGIDSALPQTG